MASFFTLAPADRKSWRWSLAIACVLMATFAFVVTEVFSMTGLLTWSPIFAAWGLFCMVPFFIAWRGISDLHAEPCRIWDFLKTCPAWAGILLAGTTGLIFVMAIATPPLNFDVQIYHLPRQIYWLMQGSVEPFHAAHSHQISMPVLSEFIALNLLILSGGDLWHNLVQSLFLLATCGLVSLAAQTLGAAPRAAWLAVLFAVLVPVIFFEASNAKNDIILSFFILVPVTVALRVCQGSFAASTSFLLLSALSAGLAAATKGTAVAYLPAAGLALLLAYFRGRAWRALLIAAIPGCILAITPAAPQIIRNIQKFDSPAGPNIHHTNLSQGPDDLLNVAIRNIAGQFTCDSGVWNSALESRTRSFLVSLGLDPDDPATTFESQPFHLPYFAGLEDLAPAPAQTALILLLPLGFLFAAFRRHFTIALLFSIGLLSLVIFCALFRWQPWQGRLLIPAYFLTAPLAGFFLDQLRPRWLPILFAAWALASLRPHLIFAGQRPLFGESSIFRNEKTDQMSRMMPGRSNEIQKLATYLRDSKLHNIVIDGGATEIYGLLRELHQQVPQLMLQSGRQSEPGDADAIIIPVLPHAGVAVPPATLNPTAPAGFTPSWIGDYYTVFEPAPRALEPTVTARFAGFTSSPLISEIWKQGSSLKKSGRNSESQSITLKPLVTGDIQLALEGNGPEGTLISIQGGDFRTEHRIENGNFTIHANLHLPHNTPLFITTTEPSIFWTKIRILQKGTPIAD
jgi:hypothetical protein